MGGPALSFIPTYSPFSSSDCVLRRPAASQAALAAFADVGSWRNNPNSNTNRQAAKYQSESEARALDVGRSKLNA